MGATWPKVDMRRNGCFTSRDYGWGGRAATWCLCDQHLCNNIQSIPIGQGQTRGQIRGQAQPQSQPQPQVTLTRRRFVTPSVRIVRRQGQRSGQGQRQGHRQRVVTSMNTLNDQRTQVTRTVPEQANNIHKVVFIHRIPVPTLRPRPSSQDQNNNNQQRHQLQQHQLQHQQHLQQHQQQEKQHQQQLHDHMSHKYLQEQQLEQWKEQQKKLGVNSQYSRHQQRLIEDAYDGGEQHFSPIARIAPAVDVKDLEQGVQGTEVLEPEILDQEVQEQDIGEEEENAIKQITDKAHTKSIKSEFNFILLFVSYQPFFFFI